MKIPLIRLVDYYAGGFLLLLLRVPVVVLGKVLKRDHDPRPRGRIVVLKLLGGGSLVLAQNGLVGLRRSYPNLEIILVCTRRVAPFAETLGVFNRIVTIDDRSPLALLATALRSWWTILIPDTVLSFEVHSRLATVYSVLTMARNRFCFYKETVFWRRSIATHLVYYNVFYGAYYFYERMIADLGAKVVDPDEGRAAFEKHMGFATPEANGGGGARNRIAIGQGCSDMGRERMLTAEQWRTLLVARLADVSPGECIDQRRLNERDGKTYACV